ncbi:MAG: PQQ-dependent sugar dehydrogenase [Phycisphaerae bacterium]|nr:PQQ-dependent sugar dehydrogenase [Phycisphaerae bacterium]
MSIRHIAAIAATTLALGIESASFAGDVPAVRTKRIVTGLSYPTFVTHAPGDTTRLFVLEKKGVIKIIDLATNTVLATPFLNIDPIVVGGASVNDEQGLLGLAFHPDYATNGYFFVYYTASGTNFNTVARFKVSSDPNIAEPTGLTVIAWSDPFSNHNGGWIDFGPDGYLYIASGDGGSGNDPGNRAQTITNMKLGKMLRIIPDVTDSVAPHYTNPTDNPFVGEIGDDEIWAYGLRNPWRCSFDRQTGDLWIADVGQNAVEEVNFQPAGAEGGWNYGWRCKEGNSCTGLSGCSCTDPNLIAPIKTHNHVSGTNGSFSITGGYVYRGCAYPELAGTYFYADWPLHNVWSFRYDGKTITEFTVRNSQITPSIDGFVVNQIASFGEDANGEMYIVDHGSTTTGQIFKIIPADGEVTCVEPNPSDLNGDGLVDASDLAILLGAWGGKGLGDLNDDGVIDAADLAILLGSWSSK